MKRRDNSPENYQTHNINGVQSEQLPSKLIDQKHGLIACKLHLIEHIPGQQVPTDEKEQIRQIISKGGYIAIEG